MNNALTMLVSTISMIFGGMLFFMVFIEPAKERCEKPLPRTEHCVMVAIPEKHVVEGENGAKFVEK